MNKHAWLRSSGDRSVTELEFLHGVLNDTSRSGEAFFYFRSPAAFDKSGYSDSGASQKLEALKQRIRDTGCRLQENYADARTLGDLILTDLTALVDRLFPVAESLDALDREWDEQQAFAEARCRFYQERALDLERLDLHLRGDGPPLAVLGDSGAGKSTLLAAWASKYAEENPDALMIAHFIGATPSSTDSVSMVRRILEELNQIFELRLDIPSGADELRVQFANALHLASGRARVVLLLDGLDQLDDYHQALDLAFLAPKIPNGIRVILSTLPGRPLDEIKRRGWPTHHVELLTGEERRQFTRKYLGSYGKDLDGPRLDRVIAHHAAGNPLYLRTLLEELRICGDHSTLDELIDEYLSTTSPKELFSKILARYERDYERERPALVRDTMRLLAASRRGLSQSELLKLLGKEDRPLPAAWWAPFYSASYGALASRSGLIGFSHEYLRQAVEDRYGTSKADKSATHVCLAEFFVSMPFGPRQVDELPWQLFRAHKWDALSSLLTDAQFFGALYVTNPIELRRYWAAIETSTSTTLLKAYRPLLAHLGEQEDATIWRLSMLLRDRGHVEESAACVRELKRRSEATSNSSDLAYCLGNLAGIHGSRGEFSEAMRLLKQQEQLCSDQAEQHEMVRCLVSQAMIAGRCGEIEAALRLYQRAESISRALPNNPRLANCLTGQATLIVALGQLERAATLLEEAEHVLRRQGYIDELALCLGDQACVRVYRGDSEAALALFDRQEAVCRDLAWPHGLARCLSNKSVIFNQWGRLDEALSILSEAENLFRNLGAKDELSTCLGNQAIIRVSRGELKEAFVLLEAQKEICRELGTKDGYARTLGNEALILTKWGRLDEAMALFDEQESLLRDLGAKDLLGTCLGNKAGILIRRGYLDQAMILLKSHETIAREVGNENELTSALGNQAVVLQKQDRLDDAFALHKQVEQLQRRLKNRDGLAGSLNNQASNRARVGRRKEALEILDEAEKLCREFGLREALATCMTIKAKTLKEDSDTGGAAVALTEAEKLWADLESNEGLIHCLSIRAEILVDGRRFDDAINLLDRQEKICRELGIPRLLACNFRDQAFARWKSGRESEARDLIDRASRIAKEEGLHDLAQELAKARSSMIN